MNDDQLILLHGKFSAFKNSSWKYFNIILQEKSLLLIHYIIIILILDKKKKKNLDEKSLQ